MLELLDSTTYNHCNRVKRLTEKVMIAQGSIDEELLVAALFHDIGKLYIPTRILDKHEGLTELEREIVDRHAYYGYRILKELPFSERTAQIVLFHHGYRADDALRLGISVTEDVLLCAGMLMTVDRFEALTTDRPYHRSVSAEQAARIIARDVHDEETLRVLCEAGE